MVPLALQAPPAEIVFRPVRDDDAHVLQRDAWPDDPLTRVMQRVQRARKMAGEGRGLGVVIVGDAAAPVWGYGQLTLWAHCAELSDLVILPAQRGRGLGTALVQYLTRSARGMGLSCAEIGASVTNPRALALYRRLGFADAYTVRLAQDQVIYLRLSLIG